MHVCGAAAAAAAARTTASPPMPTPATGRRATAAGEAGGGCCQLSSTRRASAGRASATPRGRDADGNPEHVDGVAIIRHDGVIISGRLELAEGGNNYLGETAAQTIAGHAAKSLREEVEGLNGGEARPLRVAAIFDATSPVLAWLRFRRVHDRVRQRGPSTRTATP